MILEKGGDCVWKREVFMWAQWSVDLGSADPLEEAIDKQIQQSLVRVRFEVLSKESDLEFWTGRQGLGQGEL